MIEIMVVDIESAVFRGYGFSQLAKEIGCSVDLLKEEMEKFPRDIRRKYIPLLQNNEKKWNYNHTDANDIDNADNANNANGSAEMNIEKDKKELEKLRSEQREFRSEVIGLEVERERILTRRREIKNDLIKVMEEQRQIRKQLLACKEKVSKKAAEMEETSLELEQLHIILDPKRRSLNEVTAKIEEYETVRIHVSNEDITVDAMEEIEIPSMWQTIYNKFSKSEGLSDEFDSLLEELTRKDMKMLAKLVALVAYMKGNNLKYSLVIDNENVEMVYDFMKTEVGHE